MSVIESIDQKVEGFKEKLAEYASYILFILCLLLSGIIGFFLGSSITTQAKDDAHEVAVGEIDLETLPASSYSALQQGSEPAQETESPSPGSPSEITSEIVVASKSGSKYHFPTCGGAKQIKEENKIFFKNSAEARAAGYTPASNCKGLK